MSVDFSPFKAQLLEKNVSATAAAKWIVDDSLDFDELCDALAKAFTDNEKASGEAIMNWCINHVRGINEGGTRFELVKFMILFHLTEVRTKNTLVMAKKNSSDNNIVSIAVVSEYGPSEFGWWAKKMHGWRQIYLAVKMGIQGQLPELCNPKTDSMKEDSKKWNDKGGQMKQLEFHEKYGPAGQHLYVSFVSTDPNQQGQGHGSELMMLLNNLADQQGLSCYLETATPARQKFYEKFGYQVVGQEVLRSDSDAGEEDMTVLLMVRQPNSS